MRLDVHRLVLVTCYVAAAAVVGWLAWQGVDYYATPLVERPRHDGYWQLKPGGSRGHLLGVVGSGLMVVMLVYSLRKRWRPLRRAGQLRKWLDFHIFCGIYGPLLVILHSSFKVQGLVALSFWSMIAVALSGVVGRYLYLQIPRTRAGDERTLADVEQESRELSTRLRELGINETQLAELDAIAAIPSAWSRRSRLRAFERAHGGGELVNVIEHKAQLQRRILRWHRLQEVFHHWHVFHKPFAIVMYLFLIVHIVVVTMTGYGFR